MGRGDASPLADGHADGADEPAVPLVSVIVPVRDDTGGVRELIERLGQQTLPRSAFEVVVGDDGSRDDSCASLATEDGWVRVVRGSPRTSYAARNQAASAARASLLAFCDSDCRPEPEWLAKGLVALEEADVAAGEVRFVPPDPPTVWSLLTADMFLDQKRNVALGRGVTANLFVRRALFTRLGGFDATLPSGGDYDFVRRSVAAGAELAYAGDALVHHPTLDDHRTFLGKVRKTNHWHAVRQARDRRRPGLSALLTLVPGLGVAVARHDAHRPIWRLEPSRLRASGLRPGWRSNLRAMVLLYFVVAHVAGVAQLRGWLEGRRMQPTVLGDDGAGVGIEQATEVAETA